MMDEYNKCRFCRSYDNDEGCMDWFCSNKDSYKPNKKRIIEKAKEENMSVSDVIALIKMDD